ncbi:hypothetical protein KIW84_044202 [Lathyrus oleraceus]|uniref:PB1-like domain-containing protein n=1 Tax=Pisum sativum TaxID=3888 RepID=A0A9D4XK22_PEA|nr:hypothetical protein KIW84_044202 [Pisum sativum]
MKNSGSQKERNEMVKYCVRPTKTNKIRLRIHHRGKLVETHVKWYVNEKVTEMNWSWDADYMSYMELKNMVKCEGYVNIKCLWYWNPAYSFSRGLRPLNNDQDVLQFSKDVVDAEDDVQCIGFKSANVIEEVTTDRNGVIEEVTIDPNGVAEEVTIDPNVVTEEFTTDVNNEYGQEGIDEDYVASEGSFKDNKFQFSEESEESEMDWTKVLPKETLGEVSSCQNKKDQLRCKRIDNHFWQVVTLIEDHTCHKTADNKSAKTKQLANKFASILRHNPHMKPLGLRAEAIER